MTKQVRKARDLLTGVLRGFEAPADTFTVNHYAYPHTSMQEAMRSDWKRVGNEMRGAIVRGNVKAAS